MQGVARDWDTDVDNSSTENDYEKWWSSQIDHIRHVGFLISLQWMRHFNNRNTKK